jgi:catalase (peroxidase I)
VVRPNGRLLVTLTSAAEIYEIDPFSVTSTAVRLGFHDAGSWSTASTFGGAGGSLLLSSEEISRPENNGLQEVRSKALDILDKYSPYGVGAGLCTMWPQLCVHLALEY